MVILVRPDKPIKISQGMMFQCWINMNFITGNFLTIWPGLEIASH